MAARHWDGGTYTVTVAKAQQAVSFNATFDAAPEVFATGAGASIVKGVGATSITTTGFNIYNEVAELTNWLAREIGYDDGAEAAAGSSGTIGQTLASVTQTATSTFRTLHTGSIAQTLPAATQAAVGSVPFASTIAQSLPNVDRKSVV